MKTALQTALLAPLLPRLRECFACALAFALSLGIALFLCDRRDLNAGEGA